MIFPVIRYHPKYGCESFSNQEDLDWALGHGWIDRIPEGYDLGYEPSRIPNELVMKIIREKTAADEKKEVKEPKKRYPSQMNLSELKNECINRGIAPREMTKMQIRKAMEKHDNRINTDK
jgi:hypothetical protein